MESEVIGAKKVMTLEILYCRNEGDMMLFQMKTKTVYHQHILTKRICESCNFCRLTVMVDGKPELQESLAQEIVHVCVKEMSADDVKM